MQSVQGRTLLSDFNAQRVNVARAAKGLAALRVWVHTQGLPFKHTDLLDYAAGLLSDLMHMAREYAIPFADAYTLARDNFYAEVVTDDPKLVTGTESDPRIRVVVFLRAGGVEHVLAAPSPMPIDVVCVHREPPDDNQHLTHILMPGEGTVLATVRLLEADQGSSDIVDAAFGAIAQLG